MQIPSDSPAEQSPLCPINIPLFSFQPLSKSCYIFSISNFKFQILKNKLFWIKKILTFVETLILPTPPIFFGFQQFFSRFSRFQAAQSEVQV
jgi:hypothetical protein